MACESLAAMMRDVCDMDAGDIKARVDLDKKDGTCLNEADGGIVFSARGAIPNEW